MAMRIVQPNLKRARNPALPTLKALSRSSTMPNALQLTREPSVSREK
jgi:hypothetical protein